MIGASAAAYAATDEVGWQACRRRMCTSGLLAERPAFRGAVLL